MSPQNFDESQVDHWISGNYFLSWFLSNEEANELDVGIVESHGDPGKNDRDSKDVAVVPETEFGKFERSEDKFNALLFG